MWCCLIPSAVVFVVAVAAEEMEKKTERLRWRRRWRLAPEMRGKKRKNSGKRQTINQTHTLVI